MKNRKLWVSLLAGLLALIMVLGLFVSVIPTYASAESSASIQQRLEKLEKEKDAIDEEVKKLEGQLSDNYDEMSEIVAQKDLIDQEVFLLNQQITNINTQISEYGLLIAEKQDELDAAEEHLAQLQEKNKERIRAMEKNGGLSYWSVIFKANSFVDLLDRLKMIEEIADADKQRLEEMALAAEKVSQAKGELETQKTALEASKAELDEAQAELAVKRSEADALLAELVAVGQEYEDLLEESEDEQAKLAQDIAKAEKEYNAAKKAEQAAANPGSSSGSTAPSTSAPSSSGWIKPCRYICVTSPFGGRIHPISGVWKMHYGIDLANNTGTPIYAAKSGTVTTASYNGSAGYYVSINHGDGFSSIYMHMTHYIVYGGQSVEQGQVIGYMGSTGGSTGPHLHFGISYNGTYVNPANYISF